MMSEAPAEWVLLRGLVREQAHWAQFPALLQKQFPQSEIKCLDVPGNGILHQQPSPANMRQLANWLDTTVGPVQKPRAIIAISMGAMLAREWLNINPQAASWLI